MTKIKFEYSKEVRIPRRAIKDAPSQGKFDEYANYLCEKYNVQVSLDDSILYLEGLGAWDNEELQDLEANKRRLLWIACLDCQEQKTNYWYMGT